MSQVVIDISNKPINIASGLGGDNISSKIAK